MDKLTLGLIALVGAIVAVTFLGEQKQDEESQPRSAIDPKMVIPPQHTGDEGMARRPDFRGDDGIVRRPPASGGKRTI
jgi:hypothetical protein